MTHNISLENLFVWNGNREKPPELYEKFMFQGKPYITIFLEGHPMVIDIETDDVSPYITILIAGANSGLAVIDVLIKAEIASVEEIAAAFNNEDGKQANALIMKFLHEYQNFSSREDKMAFLKSKGISMSEILDMIDTLQNRAMASMPFMSIYPSKGKIM